MCTAFDFVNHCNDDVYCLCSNLLLCLFYAFYLATIIAVSLRTSDPVLWNMLCAVELTGGFLV